MRSKSGLNRIEMLTDNLMSVVKEVCFVNVSLLEGAFKKISHVCITFIFVFRGRNLKRKTSVTLESHVYNKLDLSTLLISFMIVI